MKRITLAMALAACICLTGCKGKANRQPKGNNEAAVEETVTEEPVLAMTGENEDQISFCDYDTGFAAYVYNEETHTLEFLPQPPINGWKAKNAHRELILPQKGKDITVHEGDFENGVDYTLKWNGMTFDM